MFKILELKNADTAVPAEVGHGYSMANKLGGGQKASDDLQGSWTKSGRRLLVGRDSEGLRKCWISSAD